MIRLWRINEAAVKRTVHMVETQDKHVSSPSSSEVWGQGAPPIQWSHCNQTFLLQLPESKVRNIINKSTKAGKQQHVATLTCSYHRCFYYFVHHIYISGTWLNNLYIHNNMYRLPFSSDSWFGKEMDPVHRGPESGTNWHHFNPWSCVSVHTGSVSDSLK